MSRRPGWRDGVALSAWVVVLGSALELCTQEVARRSILGGSPESRPDPWFLAAIAGAAALIAFASRPPVPRRMWHRGAPFLFAALFTLGVAAQLSLGARLQSDGFYYYSYLRSIAFDGDVEFSNDYRLLGLGDKPHLFNPTPTGYAQSAWTIGPAIVWAPFVAVGHLVARDLSQDGAPVSTDGVSYPYRQAICIAGLFYGLLGCWFAFRLTALFFAERLAAAAVALATAGSFMLWYLVKEPSMTHAPSMALVAGFAWAWAATRERRTTGTWGLLGLLAGFMTLVRWQNALFALLPACDAVLALYRAWRTGDRHAARRTILHGLLFTGAATVGFVPQMLAWKAIYGSYLAVSPVGPQIRPLDPHLVDILWSSRNGLLSTSPILYCSAIGLLALTATRPAVGLPVLLSVAAMTYFNASIQDWWGSAGFGGRRFDGTIPLFALGMAAALERGLALVRRYPAAVIGVAGTLLVVWNLTLMSAAQRGVMRIGESASFGDLGAEQARTFHRWFGHPFTYPASLVFALRNGISPAHYDVLGTNRLLGDPLQPYGRIDIGTADEWVVDTGWYQPEQNGPMSFRWATSEARVLLSLDHVATLRLQVHLQAFGYPGAPEQVLVVSVNGQPQPPVVVHASWQTVAMIVPVDQWRAGVNRLDLKFAWARTPAEVGLGGDRRSLAAAVDYLRVEVVR